jgi:phage shock protein A
MFQIATQVSDLISSNVSNLVECATDPAKMLKHLRREIEAAIIALQGDQAKARRRIQALGAEVSALDMREAVWGDKAEAAVAGGREDLARSALAERQSVQRSLAGKRADLAAVEAEVVSLNAAISELEARLSETRDQIEELARQRPASAPRSSGATIRSRADSKLDKISAMAQRVAFATHDIGSTASAASAAAEIDEMTSQAAIIAELEALRAKVAGAVKPAKRAKA